MSGEVGDARKRNTGGLSLPERQSPVPDATKSGGQVSTYPTPPQSEEELSDTERAELLAGFREGIGRRYVSTEAEVEALMKGRDLAEIIWTASRADEGTISATGADHVARAFLASDWLARHDAEVRARTLRWAAIEISDRLDGFPQRGLHTRARWAEQWLLLLADRAEQATQAPAEDAGGGL